MPGKKGGMEELQKCIQGAKAEDADAVRAQYKLTIFLGQICV